MLPASFPLAGAIQRDLIRLALAVGARQVADWSPAETALAAELGDELATSLPVDRLAATLAAIERGQDPLGDAFCALFTNEERRPKGATYTPQPIIDAMLAWAANEITPARVVDPGVGSARFLVAAGRRFPDAELVGIEIDPLAGLLARAHLAAAGLADRSRITLHDYRSAPLPAITGPTLFLGNPPYVRHHMIETQWKQWLTLTARSLGHDASQLAGLHVHFFLATALHGRPGDVGVLITAAEWLDVNYGRLVRELMMGTLGAKTIQVIEPTADPFPGTQTTAVITGFRVAETPPTVALGRAESLDTLGTLETDLHVRRERLVAADRWTPLTRPVTDRREGFVELGELCRVHRGQVTGANEVWVATGNPYDLPEDVLFPTVTRARELFSTEGALIDPTILRRVIDLPVDLDHFDRRAQKKIEAFLKYARSKGVDDGFIARHRKAWYSVGLRKPAPILATYMARRPPKFVRNLAEARHINIAHGLYPRDVLTDVQLNTLATYLSSGVSLHEGRTYAGGLTKFEPREMERLLIPAPHLLTDAVALETML